MIKCKRIWSNFTSNSAQTPEVLCSAPGEQASLCIGSMNRQAWSFSGGRKINVTIYNGRQSYMCSQSLAHRNIWFKSLLNSNLYFVSHKKQPTATPPPQNINSLNI